MLSLTPLMSLLQTMKTCSLSSTFYLYLTTLTTNTMMQALAALHSTLNTSGKTLLNCHSLLKTLQRPLILCRVEAKVLIMAPTSPYMICLPHPTQYHSSLTTLTLLQLSFWPLCSHHPITPSSYTSGPLYGTFSS